MTCRVDDEVNLQGLSNQKVVDRMRLEPVMFHTTQLCADVLTS